MLETTKIILTENTRSLIKKMKDAPILYILFTGMMFFSIYIFAFATFFLLRTETEFNITLEDTFFTIFFMFLLKSVADFYNNYVKSTQLSYALSTQTNQKKTIFEIFLSILLTQLIIWFSFSLFFLLALLTFRVDIGYPIEYMIFTLGVITAVCLGSSISINFFSPKRYRLLPNLILIGFYLQFRHPLYVVFTLPLAIIHVFWSIKNSKESHLFSKRKERLKERTQVKMRSLIKAIFYKETTVLWRDKLLFSFIFTSVTTGFFTGYFYLYGNDLLLPESLTEYLGDFLPSMFLFLGVFVVILYTAVFPALNLFLNEEKTMWIIRHLPVKNDTIIYGKTSALALCFLTSIPFVPYLSIFVGLEQFFYLFWFLIFSFIASIIISIPLGVKYVGKKSDIMLLYSVSMILLIVLGSMAIFATFIIEYIEYSYAIFILILLLELLILYISLKISSQILALKYN